MTPRLPYRQSPRLKNFDYLGPLAAHVVIVTQHRRPIFADQSTAVIALEWLDKTARRYAALVHAYCFMPDHVHILIEVPEEVSLQRLVRWFKQMSGYALKQSLGIPIWQVSYYDHVDHVLRKEEAIEEVARYIWNNPVAEGLVDDWSRYPLSGPRELMV